MLGEYAYVCTQYRWGVCIIGAHLNWINYHGRTGREGDQAVTAFVYDIHREQME